MATGDELVARWDAGEKMTEIADAVGLSRERVRQRLKRQGRRGRNRNGLPSASELCAAAAQSTSLDRLARRLDMTPSRLLLAVERRAVRDEVSEVLAANRRKQASERRLASQRPYIGKLRQLAMSLGHTPGQDELASVGIYHVTLNRLFGSVPAAMRAAGLEPNEIGHPPKPLPPGFGDEYAPTSDEVLLERRAQQLRRSGLASVPPGNQSPHKLNRQSQVFVRDPAVVAGVRDAASGYCEACGKLGCETDDGTRHLEVHHVRPLSEGGPDTVSNAVAVCATCHGKLHRWTVREAMKADPYARLPRLIPWPPAAEPTSSDEAAV